MNFGPVIWCFLAAALFGASPAGCKYLLDESVGPFALASLLYLGAGLATLPFSIRKPKATKSEYIRIAGAVLFGGILGPIFLMLGLYYGNAGTTSLLLNFETVATMILGWLFFKEHVGKQAWLACALIVGGGIWLTIPDEMAAATSVFWVVLACFCWGIDNHLTAVIDEFTPAQTTCIKGLLAGGFNALVAIWFHHEWGTPTSVMSGLGIGALCYGASIVLYVAGAQQLGATRSQMIFASAPYFGLLLSWFVLFEDILLSQIGSGILMFFALWILIREDHEHEHHHEETFHIHLHRHKDGHHDHQHRKKTWSILGWHLHYHKHEAQTHTHEHRSDLHHRHH